MFFSRTTGPEKLKLTWKHSWVVQILNCSNHDPHMQGRVTMGSQYFTQKYIGKSLKIFFSRTTGPIKLKLMWKHPGVVQILNCSNHDPRGKGGATMGNQSFIQKYIGKIFENLLLKNHWARKAETYVVASWGSVDSKLFKS